MARKSSIFSRSTRCSNNSRSGLSDGEILVRILLEAEQTEAVLDLLEKRYTGKEGNRILILAVEASLPRVEPEPAELREIVMP
jgi:hypothetical protein